MSCFRLILTFCWLFGVAFCDIYLHNPRGSNNRLVAPTGNRRNANRLFDSQNNAKGGYNVGEIGPEPVGNETRFYKPIYFQSGSASGEDSLLTVELYYQHGCSSDEANCNVVIQFMCQPEGDQSSTWQLRDGSSEETPKFTEPKTEGESASQMAARRSADLRASADLGQQESWDSYNHCYLRRRNGGLFTADQRLRDNALGYSSAAFTRQNAKGKRFGYECAEERDYYPYWHPNQWKDIAVLVDDASDCQQYRQKSFSAKNTLGVCAKPDGSRDADQLEEETAEGCTKAGYKWIQVYNYLEKAPGVTSESSCTSKSTGRLTYIWGVPYDAANFNTKECLVATPAVDCKKAPWSRPNHLGMDESGKEFPRYLWTLPYFPSTQTQRCVLRARYNISTSDFNPNTTDSTRNQVRPGEVAQKYRDLFQLKAADVRRWTNSSRREIFETVSQLRKSYLDQAAVEIKNGNSPVRQDARVQLYPNFPEVALAVNTDQFGRTFEDRTHAFRLAARPAEVPTGRKIHNLNVRGKRGNNVQVYNAVEYDFVPNDLKISPSDLIHIQWTGSNHQVGDGEGKALTDRSNIVQIEDYTKNYPLSGDKITMWRNAKVYWTPFHSNALVNGTTQEAGSSSIGNRQQQQNDPLSLSVRAQKQETFLNAAINEQTGHSEFPAEPKEDADQAPHDREKDLDDDPKTPGNYMRKKRQAANTNNNVTVAPSVVGPNGLTDQQLALALMTSGYYWCVEKTGCPSYVPDSFVASAANKAKLNAKLDQASASFSGVLVSFNRGTYYYMSTRNNKFTNRSQKGRIVVS